MIALELLILHWFISLFCQSFFLHRYSSHRMFMMNNFWEKFFYLLTFISQGPSFLNPRSYAIMHNQHHQHSDTPSDPHSPYQSKNIWDMMIKTYFRYMAILKDKQSKINSPYPTWSTIDNFAESNLNILLWVIVYPLVYYVLDVPALFYLLLPIHFLVGPIQGAIVNWFGHKLGYRNFNLPDKSKNTLPIDFLLMGELYQNNHHKNGKKMNFAYKFYEIDLTYAVAYLLLQLGIIKPQRSTNEILATKPSVEC